MTLVRRDFISNTLLVVMVVVLLYSATFGADLMLKSLFVVVMGLSGMALARRFKEDESDPNVTDVEVRQIVLWSGISFGVIFFMNLTVRVIPPIFAVVDPVGARLFAVLIAIAEEELFRGFVTPYMARGLGRVAGAVTAGVIFGVYHLAIYQDSFSNLLVIFAGGIILSFAALRTGRLSTTSATHVINNWLAVR